MKQLLSELRRRNVFRVAAAYLVVGWLVMQIVSVMTPALQLPGWVNGFFAVFLIVCLPIALLMAWAFEMTPAGVQKTKTVDGNVEFRPLGGTDFVLIGLMVVVLGVIGFQMTNPGTAPAPQTVAVDTFAAEIDETATLIADIETRADPVIEASIAVLPFADFSPAGDQQYFSDGISEELLNALAQFHDLRVAARTSAFSFRGEVDLRDVGEALGVAHVLEGSVRHAGERVRITAQLIRVSDGFHLWSETYERTLDDVFEIQDDIVQELSRVLQVRLGVGSGSGRATSASVDPSAYEQYLRGLSLWANRAVGENRENAIRAYARTTEIDPDFAEGWASYGKSLAMTAAQVVDLSRDEKNRISLRALNQALTLDPENARAHSGLADYYAASELDIVRALESARHAYEIAPNAAHTSYSLAGILFFAGDISQSMHAFDRTRSIDALNDLPTIFHAEFLAQLGRVERQQTVMAACLSCTEIDRAYFNLLATIQSGSPVQVRTALTDFTRLLEESADETAESIEENAGYIEWWTDYTEAMLGTEGRGTLAAERIELDRADLMDAAFLTRIDEDTRALDILHRRYTSETFFTDMGWFLNPGRWEFPERILRHPRFHEFWQLPGMPELAAIRRANGMTTGLPLPMDVEE
jgi:TolB-like protein